MTLDVLLKSMSDSLFTQKEPYLVHMLRKNLGRCNRKHLRGNLTDECFIIYTDYSKGCYYILKFSSLFFYNSEYALTQPETLKLKAFGSSNRTFQIIPQVETLHVAYFIIIVY